jgi:hypothetical protein
MRAHTQPPTYSSESDPRAPAPLPPGPPHPGLCRAENQSGHPPRHGRGGGGGRQGGESGGRGRGGKYYGRGGSSDGRGEWLRLTTARNSLGMPTLAHANHPHLLLSSSSVLSLLVP